MTTLSDALDILNSSLDTERYTKSDRIKNEKRSIATTMALIAIGEQLERANQLKEAELKARYGKDIIPYGRDVITDITP